MLRTCQMIILHRINIRSKFNTGSQTADNYYASVYSVDQGVKRILEQLKKTDSMTIQLFSLPPIMVRLSMVLCR